MLHALSLGLVLYCLWLLLSGYFQALLLGLGGVSVLAIIWIAHRMDVIDHEGHPIHLTAGAILYWPWLMVEIFKANIAVAKAIVQPKMPISPTVIEVKSSQETELGQVIFANSITLTPGTVTMAVDRDIIAVHALTRHAADGLLSGVMDRRVSAMEAHQDPYRRRVPGGTDGGAR